jgi:uncharacterized protein (DUF427 family)
MGKLIATTQTTIDGYEGLAGYWPSASGKWADMVNPMWKYVGSTTLSGVVLLTYLQA